MKKGMGKKYWLSIDSYVHIAVKKERVLFYNPYTGKMLESSNDLEILRLVKRLLRPGNMQTVLLTDRELECPAIRDFVESIRDYFLGDVIDACHSRGKPVQMPPMLKISKDVEILKKIPNGPWARTSWNIFPTSGCTSTTAAARIAAYACRLTASFPSARRSSMGTMNWTSP